MGTYDQPVHRDAITGPVGSQSFVGAYIASRQAYFRADREIRLHMLHNAIHENVTDDVIEGVCAAILREAWIEDPYISAVRQGTMFSLIEEDYPIACSRSVTDSRLVRFGPSMMYHAEHETLRDMVFPQMVYRGGAGPEDVVRQGRSWTLDPKKARFFAEEWPRRFGTNLKGVLLQMEISKPDVICYIDERQEREIILVGRQGLDRNRCVRLALA